MENFVNREDLYKYNEPALREQTKNRLQEITDLGMEETGVASFGISGVMSGLYIEHVWNFTDKEWNEYMDWVKSLKSKA